MDGLGLTTATTTTTSCSLATNGLLFPSLSATRLKVRAIRNVSFTRRRKFSVLAAKEDPKLDQWEQMELKFGRLIGEDPKLTLAKIMAKKTNPDASFMEIEKAFYKNKGEIVEIEEVPFDVSNEKKSSSSLDGLNLVRPDPKKGVIFQTEDKPIAPEIRKPVQTVKLAVDSSKSSVPNVLLRKPNTFSEDVVEDKKGVKFQTDNKPITPEIRKQSQTIKMAVDSSKSSVPNVILRKPNTFNEDVIEDKRPRYRIKPNLSLKLGNEQAKEKFSDMTMLRRPEPMSVNMKDVDKKEEGFGDVEPKVVNDSIGLNMGKSEVEDKFSGFTLSNKPEVTSFQVKVDEKQKMFRDAEANVTEYTEEKGLKAELEATRTANATKTNLETGDSSILNEPELEDDSVIGMQLLEQRNMKSFEEETAVHEPSDTNLVDSNVKYEAALLGKPKRLDKSVKEMISSSVEETVPVNLEIYGSSAELKNLPSASPLEEADWSRAEDLVKIGEKEEVELISSSTKGFMVSFGSLIGILPYRNLAAKWKFLAFESWLRQKGLDPSMYKQNLGIIESYDVQNKTSLDSSLDPEIEKKIDGEISPDMKLENLLRIYDQEKLKFLSSLVDQKIKVFVVMADRKSKKLIFSMRPKENEELFVKKRSLMAKLRIGDVVKCCIKKITYFGIFVEVEGVPALIHQSEVSWAATLDTASYFKIGQIVDAKVHQLDFTLGRIFLSLKEIMPDPLTEALESVVGGLDPLDGRLEIAQSDTEWADVESLVKELQQIEGIQSVSKGRFFLSPGLAPTFQVYMASMFENQYKLLARSGNKVQEVIVQASLGKEEMKSTILSCTSRVE